MPKPPGFPWVKIEYSESPCFCFRMKSAQVHNLRHKKSIGKPNL
jgi:hypothetical protein